LQGLLEWLDKPYVGAGVLGSALGMDKDVMKRLLQQAGISVGQYVVWPTTHLFSYPVFVKPANLGSSIGVSKCKNKSEETVAIN